LELSRIFQKSKPLPEPFFPDLEDQIRQNLLISGSSKKRAQIKTTFHVRILMLFSVSNSTKRRQIHERGKKSPGRLPKKTGQFHQNNLSHSYA